MPPLLFLQDVQVSSSCGAETAGVGVGRGRHLAQSTAFPQAAYSLKDLGPFAPVGVLPVPGCVTLGRTLGSVPA